MLHVLIFEGENAIGLGAIIRNDQGEVIAAKTWRIDGLVDVVGAELLATMEDLKLARRGSAIDHFRRGFKVRD